MKAGLDGERGLNGLLVDETEVRPKGIFEIDMLRLKDGRCVLEGDGRTTPSRLA